MRSGAEAYGKAELGDVNKRFALATRRISQNEECRTLLQGKEHQPEISTDVKNLPALNILEHNL